MYFEDELSSAELELIKMADEGLAKHGISIDDIDPDADIEAMAANDQARVDEMVEEVVADDEPEVDPYANEKAVKKLFAIAKQNMEKRAVEPTPVQPEQNREADSKPLSKKEQAIVIFNDVYGRGHGRKATLQRFMDVLGMSKAGASTYFQNIKSGKWR